MQHTMSRTLQIRIRRANAFLQCLLEKSRACLAIALLSVALPAIESIHLSDTEREMTYFPEALFAEPGAVQRRGFFPAVDHEQ